MSAAGSGGRPSARELTEEVVELVDAALQKRAARLCGHRSAAAAELALRGIVKEALEEAEAEMRRRYSLPPQDPQG